MPALLDSVAAAPSSSVVSSSKLLVLVLRVAAKVHQRVVAGVVAEATAARLPACQLQPEQDAGEFIALGGTSTLRTRADHAAFVAVKSVAAHVRSRIAARRVGSFAWLGRFAAAIV